MKIPEIVKADEMSMVFIILLVYHYYHLLAS